MAEARFSGSDALYVDLTSPNPSTSGITQKNDTATVPDEIWIADEEDNTMPSLEEAKLKKDEMNLYDELLESDVDKRREKTQVASEFEGLQKQVLHLKALIAEKDAKLTALTQQDANVRKNICSLYKTARAEIDHKDSLLTEANRKLDSVLYRRNLTSDQLEKQLPQSSSEKHNANFKLKSNEDKAAGRENSKGSKAESNDHNKSLSDGNQKNVEQASTKRKRSSSSPSDNKNTKNETNSYLDKRQNCNLNNDYNTPQPVIKDNLNKKQSFDINSDQNTTKLVKTENLNINQSHNSNTGQNSIHLANNEHLNKKPKCDLNSGHNNNQSSAMNQEPSIAEVFSKMQELAFKDPAATNAIFFNLLPGELRQSFLEFEQTQKDALHKLKQSFVSCYFTQCSASASGSSDVTTPEKSSYNNAEAQTSSVFFFQPNSSQSRTENSHGLAASENHSDSISKPQETVSEGKEVKKESEVQKSDRKPGARCKPPKEDVLKLHKYRDENLTLYTQRQLRRHQN